MMIMHMSNSLVPFYIEERFPLACNSEVTKCTLTDSTQ